MSFRHEGRSWYTAHRGRLWIAAAAKVPLQHDIDQIEDEYIAYYQGWFACVFVLEVFLYKPLDVTLQMRT